MQGDAHLSPGGEDVDRTVVIETGKGAIDRRRLSKFLDLVAQGGDLITCLLNGDS